MYQFYFKISKINKIVNTIFKSPDKLTSYFDVALNKRNAGPRVCILCMVVFMQRFNVSGCQKTVSETYMVSIDYDRTSNVYVDANVGAKNNKIQNTRIFITNFRPT